MKTFHGDPSGYGWSWGNGSQGSIYVTFAGLTGLLPNYDRFRFYPATSNARLAFALVFNLTESTSLATELCRDIQYLIVSELDPVGWSISEEVLRAQIEAIQAQWRVPM